VDGGQLVSVYYTLRLQTFHIISTQQVVNWGIISQNVWDFFLDHGAVVFVRYVWWQVLVSLFIHRCFVSTFTVQCSCDSR